MSVPMTNRVTNVPNLDDPLLYVQLDGATLARLKSRYLELLQMERFPNTPKITNVLNRYEHAIRRLEGLLKEKCS